MLDNLSLGDVGTVSEAEPESDLEDAGLTLSGDMSRDLRICLQKARRMGDYHQIVISFQLPYINEILDYERLQVEGLWTSVFFLHSCVAIASICWRLHMPGQHSMQQTTMPTPE